LGAGDRGVDLNDLATRGGGDEVGEVGLGVLDVYLQRLKPTAFSACYGTAEAVPLSKTKSELQRQIRGGTNADSLRE
jgi:hypothetical protein